MYIKITPMKYNHFIFAIALFTIYGCSDSKKQHHSLDSFKATEIPVEQLEDVQQEEEITVDRTAVVKREVQSIYDKVAQEYRACSNNPGGPNQDFYANYCSESYNNLLREAKKYAMATGDIVHDSDPWIAAQDWDSTIAFEVIDAKLTNNDKAIVALRETNFGKTSETLRVVVIREHNVWKIDDFQYYHDGRWLSDRSALQQITNQ